MGPETAEILAFPITPRPPSREVEITIHFLDQTKHTITAGPASAASDAVRLAQVSSVAYVVMRDGLDVTSIQAGNRPH